MRFLSFLLLVLLLSGRPAHSAAKTRSPHRQAGLQCNQCHTTAGWKEVRFEHAATSFPLEGRHISQPCLACHRVEDFSSAQPACSSCHTDYHQGAVDADCALCHTPAAWKPATFSHERTAFPLWGAHQAVACVQCHADERTFQFAIRPETCFDCHERDLGRASVAVHLEAGPDCETCHTLDQWQGGHNPAWFEIRSGHHEVDCGRCHQREGDYQSYTCASCHRFSLDVAEHRGLDPQDARCLECHAHGF